MKQKHMELIFILDCSGSMDGLQEQTIKGFNDMILKQKECEGDVYVTTVLFNDKVKKLHNAIPLKELQPLTEKDYQVSGYTALLDAVGQTILSMIQRQKHAQPDKRADKVMFIITTDGMENASREFTYASLKRLINAQKTNYQWEFIFLGANIDAEETAMKFGINRNRTSNFISDSKGTTLNYRVLSETIKHYRKTCQVKENWNEEIKEDYNNRT